MNNIGLTSQDYLFRIAFRVKPQNTHYRITQQLHEIYPSAAGSNSDQDPGGGVPVYSPFCFPELKWLWGCYFALIQHVQACSVALRAPLPFQLRKTVERGRQYLNWALQPFSK